MPRMSNACAMRVSRSSLAFARGSARSPSWRAGPGGGVTPSERRREMADPVVLYEVDDKVSVITLNRPDKLYAISPELMQQLLDVFPCRGRGGDQRRPVARPGAQLLRRLRHRPQARAGRSRLARRPDQSAQALGAAARFRDDAVEPEKAGN